MPLITLVGRMPLRHPDRVHHQQAELSDDTFIAVDRAVVAAAVADPGRWALWWPDLSLRVSRDRGVKGQQWTLTGARTGTAEIYLEPWQDGTVLHLFLRLRFEPGTTGARVAKELRRRTLAWKRSVHRLKDELEGDRRAGTPAR